MSEAKTELVSKLSGVNMIRAEMCDGKIILVDNMGQPLSVEYAEAIRDCAQAYLAEHTPEQTEDLHRRWVADTYFNAPHIRATLALSRKPKGEAGQSVTKPNIPGYIYLMKCHEYHKIGLSVSPHERQKQLSPLMPYPITLECILAVEKMGDAETAWHERFESQKVNGEWFDLTLNDIKEFTAQVGAVKL